MIANLKPYPKYKESGLSWLGKIPEHWNVRRLRASVTDCINGIWGADPNGEDDLICVRVADFDRNTLSVSLKKKTMRSIPLSARARRILEKGDLLLEKSGGGEQQPVGAVVLYGHEEHAVSSNFVARMPMATGYDGAFVNYLHFSLYAQRINVRSIKQTTGIQNLDWKAYLAEPVAFPPIVEQVSIVRYLNYASKRLDRAIWAKRKVIFLLNEQKQAIIHRAVTRGHDPTVSLKPSGISGIGDIPQHWVVERVKNIFRLRTEKSGVAHGMELLSVYTHIGVRPRKDLKQTGNKASSTDDYWIVHKGDLVVNKLLAWMGAIGSSNYEGVTSPAYDILKPIRPLCSDYFHHLFRTKLYLQKFKQRSRGIMDMRLRLYFDQLGQIPVPIPPVEEQFSIIANYFNATTNLNNTISRLEREIELLREYRTRLIADVVTGKLDVREAAVKLPADSLSVNIDESAELVDEGESVNEEVAA